MGYVKFKGSSDVYQVKLKNIGDNLVRLYPPLPNVELTTGFELLTRPKDGKVYGNYLAYTTLYRKTEEGAVILSNDGSVWVEPVYKVTFATNGTGEIKGELEQTPKRYEELVVPEVIPDENYEFIGWSPSIPEEGIVDKDVTFVAQLQYIPTLEEVKTTKKQEVGVACNAVIASGVDVTFPDGTTEHFSLEENGTKHDQINLFGKQYQLASGATVVEYHQDGQPCKYYPAEYMQMIITAAMEWVSYHTTYCNSLNMWIAGATSKEEVSEIFYGADIPEEYQSEVLKDYLKNMEAVAGEAVS